MSHVLYRAPGQPYPVAARGDGIWLEDANERRYLDMSGGAAVSLLGHGHPDVLRATTDALNRLAFAHGRFFTTAAQEQLADRLAARFGDPGARAYFSSGGSEANETAVKMAWQYWRARGKPEKSIVVSRAHSYHGNTFLTLSLSGNPLRRAASAAPLLDWPRIPPCYAYREQLPDESVADYALRAASGLAQSIDLVGAERVAAFICEPVVGASLGAVPAVDGYLKEIRRICDERDVLLILDEVMCGSGRCGTYFAWEHDAARPDIVTLGKGISAGYQPLAATVCSATVADTLTRAGFSHGFTYVGHATACAAGCAVQNVIDRDRLIDRIRERGAACLEHLKSRFGTHPNVGDVRGRGLLLALELVRDRASKAGFTAPVAESLRRAAQQAGLICYPGEALVDDRLVPHVLLAPPVLVTDAHMSEACDILESVLASQLPPS